MKKKTFLILQSKEFHRRLRARIKQLHNCRRHLLWRIQEFLVRFQEQAIVVVKSFDLEACSKVDRAVDEPFQNL